MYTLYTRKGCNLCEISKNHLTEQKEPFTILEIGVDVDRDTVIEQFPQVKMLPVVVFDGKYVGGKDELFKHLQARQNADNE